jgi:hypothetical protein
VCHSSNFLYAYVMTYDTGFAPAVDANGQYLTLCTCEGRHIRLRALPNDWVMATIGMQLARRHCKIDLFQRVVFLAKVAEHMSFKEYWEDNRFLNRIDRVYEPREDGPLVSRSSGLRYKSETWNCHRDRDTQLHDLEYDRVLISNRFYYFGRGARRLYPRYRNYVPQGVARPKRPIEGAIQGFIDSCEREWSDFRNRCVPPLDSYFTHCTPPAPPSQTITSSCIRSP